jgi:hypothetical protein
MAMPQDSDWSWLRAAIEAPDVTVDVYEAIPEELARRIEVADGMTVLCESPTDRHQAVQHALLNALSDAARKHDQRKGTCHRVRADIDVLLTEVPSISGARTLPCSGASMMTAGAAGGAGPSRRTC